jgi:hypothetical protein
MSTLSDSRVKGKCIHDLRQLQISSLKTALDCHERKRLQTLTKGKIIKY